MNGLVPDWYDQAACRGYPTQWWFAPNSRVRRYAEAICQACPVNAKCDIHADAAREVGMWAGRVRDNLIHERECIQCGTVFPVVPKRGHPHLTCSDECSSERRRTTGRDWDRKNGVKVDRMYDLGHGTISRYNARCRCAACKLAARKYRRAYRDLSLASGAVDA